MSMIYVFLISCFIIGVALLVLYYTNEKFDKDLILIIAIILILLSLYFSVQKLFGLGNKNKDGFRS